MQSWRLKAGSRFASLVWLLAVLLVLDGAVPLAHQLSSNNLRPLFGALLLDNGLTLRPFGLSARSALIQTDACPSAAPPKAILPVFFQLGRTGSAARLLLACGEQPRPKASRLFEARAPPTVA